MKELTCINNFSLSSCGEPRLLCSASMVSRFASSADSVSWSRTTSCLMCEWASSCTKAKHSQLSLSISIYLPTLRKTTNCFIILLPGHQNVQLLLENSELLQNKKKKQQQFGRRGGHESLFYKWSDATTWYQNSILYNIPVAVPHWLLSWRNTSPASQLALPGQPRQRPASPSWSRLRSPWWPPLSCAAGVGGGGKARYGRQISR